MSMGTVDGCDINLTFKKRAFNYFYARCFDMCADIRFGQNRNTLCRIH